MMSTLWIYFFSCLFNKRVKAQEKEFFPGSTQSKEKPFKMYSDDKDITVQLTDLEEGWELDKTPSLQVLT